MGIVLGSTLAVLCLIALLLPFLKPRPGKHLDIWSVAHEETRLQRERAYQELTSLKLEHELGRVSLDEYQVRAKSYRLEAAKALRNQQILETEFHSLNESLEDEIAQTRKRLEANHSTESPDTGSTHS